MNDSWTRKASDGTTIVFKKEGDEKVGFMYYAQGRITTHTVPMPGNLTRDQVEELFADYLAGPKAVQPAPAKSVQAASEPELCGNPKCRHERGQHWDDVCHVE